MPSWSNWAGDQRCKPASVVRPATRAELVASIAKAAESGRNVRVAGSGHSFSDIALTDGVMLRLDRLDRVLDLDRSSGLVKVEAGASLSELGPAVAAQGLAMENLGDIDRQELGGAISTATHGTGTRFRNISAQVEALELVLADGSVHECSAESDREGWLAARAGLGALGAIYSVTIRCVPAFRIRRVDSPRPLDETLERIDELAGSSDHFEFYVFPHTDVALCRASERIDEPPRPRGRLSEYWQEVVMENYAMDILARLGRRFPSRIPSLARFAARQLSGSTKVDHSYRVFASQRRIRFTEMEYAIPRARAAEAVRRVLDFIPREGIEVSFPIEVRFVASDDALLSPSHERETCYVAVHMYRGMEWEPYFRGVEAIMNDYEGRPHWGKRHFQTAATLASRYPGWDRFRAVRDRLDPESRFRNAYTERVLGA
jgi:L-gulonolactone oxidase